MICTTTDAWLRSHSGYPQTREEIAEDYADATTTTQRDDDEQEEGAQ